MNNAADCVHERQYIDTLLAMLPDVLPGTDFGIDVKTINAKQKYNIDLLIESDGVPTKPVSHRCLPCSVGSTTVHPSL